MRVCNKAGVTLNRRYYLPLRKISYLIRFGLPFYAAFIFEDLFGLFSGKSKSCLFTTKYRF